MYFDDLSTYRYYRETPFDDVFCVGWLDPAHEFVHGLMLPETVAKLRAIFYGVDKVNVSVNPIRGIRPCHYCQTDKFVELGKGSRLGIGSTETWIPDKTKSKIFAAPSMILHYIMAHNYLPPIEYLDAISAFSLSEPFCGQAEYQRRTELRPPQIT